MVWASDVSCPQAHGAFHAWLVELMGGWRTFDW